ncbi:melanocortin-2 receptor accessory protein 2-like isoform X2 [Chiloscyllium plagiosum]|uniref:melanocortin-2 receptor accessory protein 2-like isoform X2 n=1 Tax=Chiloscyllium plagiosum TaxID=36176 RepID=UPI001CB82859|nr:melanocortin-2 receptor accessory protein 2-like isoform X2 [Chiloscyllium plagiosum]
MSEASAVANKTTVSNGDYIWRYEYYDDEPVSFEGLKAHKYSIVIGFWVGLAVFVIFMFFVLTLLTKTGAPHQERKPEHLEESHADTGKSYTILPRIPCLNHPVRFPPHSSRNVDLSTKQRRTNSFAINYIMSRSDKAFSRPENEESRSLFHYYVNEVIQMERQQFVNKVPGPGNSDLTPRERGDRSDDSDDPMFCPSKFNLPNFVSIDQSSSLTEDDLLMCEQPIVLENKSDRLQEIHHISD